MLLTTPKKSSTLSKTSAHVYGGEKGEREREKERMSSNCSSRPWLYTRSVCVSSAAFVCWFVPVIELVSRHFLLISRSLDPPHREVPSNQRSILHTHALDEKMHFRRGMIPLFSLLIVFLNSVFYIKWYVCMQQADEDVEMEVFVLSSSTKAHFPPKNYKDKHSVM